MHGRYFDGASARLHRVELQREEGAFRLLGEGIERRFEASEVRLEPRLGRTARVLRFADGAQLQIDTDDARLDVWFASQDRVQALVDRGERRWRWVIGAAVGVALAIGLMFTHGIPALADRAARHLPLGAEKLLAGQVVAVLDRTHFDPTTLTDERRQSIRAAFATLVHDLPRSADFDLQFRAAPLLGANALALPGGLVIVTDELVALAKHDEEILAVLAHEAGHHEYRHALRAAMQDSAVVLLIGFIAGDASSLGSLAISIPAVLLSSGYSRGFEGEADAFAFDLLARRGISPSRFADVMQRLANDAPEQPDALGWVSTHPASAARIEAARNFKSE